MGVVATRVRIKIIISAKEGESGLKDSPFLFVYISNFWLNDLTLAQDEISYVQHVFVDHLEILFFITMLFLN